MDLIRLLAEFDAEARARPLAPTGLTVEQIDEVVRLTGTFNFVSWWTFEDRTAVEAVARQAAEFRARRQRLLWRVYAHDQPAGLGEILAANGFQPRPSGTLMIFDLSQAPPPIVHGVRIRRVVTAREVDDFVRAQDLAFGGAQGSRFRDAYLEGLADQRRALFVAYIDGAPVASARLEAEPGRRFGYLFGGSVTPEWRGRGVYRALVKERAQEARRRGVRYLATDAQETSRPILERLGFTSAGRETTWVLGPLTAEPNA